MSRGETQEHDDDDARASGLSLRATRRGEILGDTYRLLELVGAGGMAEVYSAEHLRLGRTFAVKVLRTGTSQHSLRRFRREARAIARIDSEFVVGVIDCGEAGDGTPYLVMELLHGEDLRSLLDREGALPIPRAVHFVWEACQGLAAVHASSLIHRDLKPENLYVSKRANGQDWCRVLDFGIAKTDISSLTAEGAVLGTLRYMAPEQLQDAAAAGPRVDIYALGAVLYECLTGVAPHRGATVQQLMFEVYNARIPSLEQYRAGIPEGLAFAVERALAKSPSERFADVQEFASAISPYARPASVHQLDPRSETVALERKNARPGSVRGYASLALSGMLGLGVGVALHVPAAVLPASSRTAPILAVASRTSTAIASAIPAVVPTVPPGPPVIAPMSSSAAARARANGSVHRPHVLPYPHFDSENPYGR